MRPFRPLVLAAVAATSVGLALPATAAPSVPKAVDGLSARTVAQIDALAQAKRGLTATQKKVDSRLLTEAKQRRGQAAAAGVGHVATGVSTDKQGMTAVDVLGNPKAVTPAVQAVGGRVIAASVAGNAVRASVPLTAVESLAGKAGVQHVDVAAQAMLANEGGRVAPASKAELTRRISGALAQAKATAGRHHRRGRPGLDGQRGRQGPRRRRGPDPVQGDRHRRHRRRALRRRRLAGGLDRLRRPAGRHAGAAGSGGRRRRGHRDDGDRPRPRAQRAPDLRDGVHQRGELRGQHPGAARGRRRHHRRRRRLLRRVAVPGQRSGAGRHRRHQRRRALLQLRRQRAERRRPHRRQLGGRLRRVRPDDRQVRRRGARLGSGSAHPGAQPGLRRLRRRADDPAVERPAGPLRQRLRPVRGGLRRLRARRSPTTSRTATTTRSRASTCRSAPSAWPW